MMRVRCRFDKRIKVKMKEYHKIQTLFKRDMQNNGKRLLEGEWTLPEFEFLAGNQWVFTD